MNPPSSAIESAGNTAIVAPVDITSPESVTAMVAAVRERLGRIDILVNNAGVIQIKPFVDVTEEEMGRILETNLVGALRCAHVVGRVMIEQGGGRIINIGSSAGLRGRSLEVPYAASKGAINAMTLSLAVEWARYGINVNAVCPSYFETPMNERELSDPKLRATIESRTPMRRLGRPEEIAPTIVYLASAASDYVTGQIIAVDGGTTAR